jgi:TP901 family phage tail tape measure protein
VGGLPPIFAELKANIGDFKSKFGEAHHTVEKLSKDGAGHFTKLAAVGKAAMFGIGAAALGMGAVSTKLAGDFQAKLTALSTGAGETQANLGMVSQGLLKMAGDVGTSSMQLADGMYNVESAGFHGAAGLTVLKTAAQGAKVGSADMAVVADALTSALNAYHLPASKAADVTNTLVATVAAGKMKMGDLAASLGQVLPVASAAHVQLGEVGAAIATMTAQGTPASVATTRLSGLMSGMLAPTAAAKMAFKDMGLSVGAVSDKLTHQGLNAALTLITDTIGKKFKPGSAEYVAALSTMVGGQDQLKAALNLTGQNATTFAGNIKGIGTAVAGSKGEVRGFTDVQKDWNFRLASGKATAEALGISLGTALIPKLQAGMKALQSIVNWTRQHATATKVLAGIIGGVLVTAIGAYIVQQTIAMALMVRSSAVAIAHGVAAIGSAIATGFWTAAEWLLNIALMANPIGLVILAVVAVIAVIVLIATKTTWFQTIWRAVWGGIKAAAAAVGHWFTGTLWPSLQKAYQQAGAVAKWLWHAVVAAWHGIATAIQQKVAQARSILEAIGRFLVVTVPAYFERLRSAAVAKLGALLSFVRGLPGKIMGFFSGLGSKMLKVGSDIVMGLVHGIGAGISAAARAAANLAKSVLDAAKHAVGANSPATKTIQLGKWITQGLGIGMTTTTRAVVRIAEQLAELVRTALNSGMHGATSGLMRLVSRENARIDREAARREVLVKRLHAADKSYTALIKARDAYAKKVTESLAGFAGVTSMAGDQPGFNSTMLLAQMRDRMNMVTQFGALLGQLRSMGLNSAAVDEIVQKGPEQGAAYARALVSGGSAAVRQANALQTQLAGVTKAMGVSAGNAMYGVGLNAASALVRGLRSQEKALAAQMAHLARIMANQIRHALGIHSDSRVFTGVGVNLGHALANGVTSTQGYVRAAVNGLVAVEQPPARYARPVRPAGRPAGGDDRPILVQLNVDGKRLLDVLVPAAQQRKKRDGKTGLG